MGPHLHARCEWVLTFMRGPHLHARCEWLLQDLLQGLEDGHLVEKRSHVQLHCQSVQHLDHSMVDSISIAAIVSQHQTVSLHYLVVSKSAPMKWKCVVMLQ